MPFSGADPTLLRALARHMDLDLAPLLTRNAAIACDVLERRERDAAADATSYRLTSIAAWLEDAAWDLRRRAGLVEAAETEAMWATSLPSAVGHRVLAEAAAVIDGVYTGDVTADVERHVARIAHEHAVSALGSLRAAIQADDLERLATTAAWIAEVSDHPGFEAATARLFTDLGPLDTARLVGMLAAAPAADFDERTSLTLARAFAAATRGGLGWDADAVGAWFDQGATGAVQLLRDGEPDPAFLELVILTVGLGETGPDEVAGDPRLRFLLAPGSTLWQRVGTDAGDHRAVLLDALSYHTDLAIGLLSDEATLDMLLTSRWDIDQGRALGRALARIDASGDQIDPEATDAIRRRLLLHAANPSTAVPTGLRPAIGAVASTHIADLAFSLAVTGPVVESAQRPGLEVAPEGVRRIIRLAAEDVEAFNHLLVGYGSYVADTVSPAAVDDYEDHLFARADELGALTFALAYTDRAMRIDRADVESAGRLSALDVIGFLASSGVALLPGPFDDGAGFVVSRMLRHAIAEQGRRDPAALRTHNAWKQQMLDDLEYLVAVEMAGKGLLPGIDSTIDPADRSAFLYALEQADAPLELFMAIVEAQARRQREAIAEDG